MLCYSQFTRAQVSINYNEPLIRVYSKLEIMFKTILEKKIAVKVELFNQVRCSIRYLIVLKEIMGLKFNINITRA